MRPFSVPFLGGKSPRFIGYGQESGLFGKLLNAIGIEDEPDDGYEEWYDKNPRGAYLGLVDAIYRPRVDVVAHIDKGQWDVVDLLHYSDGSDMLPSMPRQPRLDIPGLLQHVIVRGIERSAIFLDDEDRCRFVDRLGSLLVETETDCYAWALLDNHFHLLLRCKRLKLSRFMRRLLTGYAVTFNLRHKRAGHLFQNRYKSIVCEEEPYLLELIRYIHLNPLRAGLVTDFDALERYPWCGHAVLLGHRPFEGQPVDEVLARFGKRLTAAQNHYREFVADGITMGKRPELVGGGLRRSRAMSGESPEKGAHDDRVLGSGDFVESLSQEDRLSKHLSPTMSLNALEGKIADLFNLPNGHLQMRGRQNECSEARALFCFLAVQKLGYPGTAVAAQLSIGPSSVSRATRRGEALIARESELGDWWEELLMH